MNPINQRQTLVYHLFRSCGSILSVVSQARQVKSVEMHSSWHCTVQHRPAAAALMFLRCVNFVYHFSNCLTFFFQLVNCSTKGFVFVASKLLGPLYSIFSNNKCVTLSDVFIPINSDNHKQSIIEIKVAVSRSESLSAFLTHFADINSEFSSSSFCHIRQLNFGT